MYPPTPVTHRVPAPCGPRLTRRLPLPLPVRRLCVTLLLAPLVGVALGAAMRGYPSPPPRRLYSRGVNGAPCVQTHGLDWTHRLGARRSRRSAKPAVPVTWRRGDGIHYADVPG